MDQSGTAVGEGGKEGGYRVYRLRWGVLGIFSLLNLSNALMWVTFSPISDISENYFGVGTSEINTLATVFLIIFPVGALLEVVLMKSVGMAHTLNIGALLTTVGCLIRYIATQCDASRQLPGKSLYAITLLGQILGAIAQPLFLNVPSHLSNAWFPVSERDVATTIGAMFSPIGNAIGQLLPVLLVSQSQSQSQSQSRVEGMPELMLVEFLVCACAMVLSYWLIKDSPPSPPSSSASSSSSAPSLPSSSRTLSLSDDAVADTDKNIDIDTDIDTDLERQCQRRQQQQQQRQRQRHISLRSTLATLWGELRALSRDRDYCILWTTFSLGTGMFNAVITLVNQLVMPRGYSNDDAGICGIVLILVGLIGAGMVSVVLGKTRRYREIVQCGFLCCFLAMVLLCCMLRPNNMGGLVFSFGLLGLVLLPMLPASYETCVEITYPLSADLSVGLLLVGGNVLGIPLTYVLQTLIALPDWGPSPLNAASLFMTVVVGVAAAMLFFLRGRYRRMEAENNNGNNLEEPLLINENGNKSY